MAEEPNKPQDPAEPVTDKPADQNLAQQARASYDQGRETAQAWQRQIETYARQNPIRALAIAAGAGFVLSLLWGRR